MAVVFKVKLFDAGPSADKFQQMIKLFQDMSLNGSLQTCTPGEIGANDWEALLMNGVIYTGEVGFWTWWPSAVHIYYCVPQES